MGYVNEEGSRSAFLRLPFVRRFLDRNMEEFIPSIAVTFLLRIAAAALAVVFNILLARVLGADGTGLYFLALTAITIAAIFGRFGLDTLMVRHVAGGMSVNNPAEVKGIYRMGVSFALAASAFSALVLFFSAPALSALVFGKPELASALRWMSLSIVPLVFMTMHAEALKGLKRPGESIFIQFVGVPVVCIAGVYFLAPSFGVTGAALAHIVSVMVMAVAGRYLYKRATVWLNGIEPSFNVSRMIEGAIPLFSAQLMQSAMVWTPTLMLGAWGTKAEVGVFEVARRTSTVISFVLVAVNVVIAPRFAELYRVRDMEGLAAAARSSVKMMALVSAPAAGLFMLAPSFVMGFFGPKFIAGATALALLSFGQFVNVITGPVGYLLVMSDKEKARRNNVAIALCI
ncbi:MAG: oligosaccharide flippase family protein, partial [Deltaproteobacteria bacterium]|nr:oligosaccharide flippase family protein [Deltaproteobacteria bacterium]